MVLHFTNFKSRHRFLLESCGFWFPGKARSPVGVFHVCSGGVAVASLTEQISRSEFVELLERHQ